MTDDERFMHAALVEARKGIGLTHPNPAVGAVIVRKGRIVSRGWHHAAGMPHAEIEAIRALKGSGGGATIYVTLEPCSSHGRTPPCTEALIQAGFSRVVYACPDPDPRHAGRAKNLLAKVGLEVTTGVLAGECAAINAAWNKWIATGLPYVIAKAGMTLDGRISSPPESRWITNEASRADAMILRSRVQAILVGGGTLREDDPQLTIRGIKNVPQPWRVVWSKSGRLPKTAKLFTDEHKERTLVLKDMTLRQALAELGRRGVASVLIEGGGRTLGEAFDRRLVDEVCFYMAPMLTGGGVPAIGGQGVAANADALRFRDVRYQRIEDDVKMTGILDHD